MAEIKFLGTGGARFVVAKQLRYSAGTFINCCGVSLILDPGPGTLVRLASSKPKIDVESVNGIILSHIHLDHSTDVNILIDSITNGGFKKRGILFAPIEAIEGNSRVVLPYLLPFLEEVKILGDREKFSFGNISFESFSHKHSVETYGIKMNLENKIVSFIVDTQFFDGLYELYKGSDTLILNVVLLEAKDGVMHLSLNDAKTIISQIKPRKAVLTHFGMNMIRAKPFILAEKLSFELGIEVVAASDGMSLSI
ncbi:MAG: MBL fold metallo-hydrolase [Caldiserica bacterium]|nr:MBL fold metallo-hydrolase [Caldisericota bacterium]